MNALLICGMSRSGTTLLTTMLDAHPVVSMGYELLPGKLPELAELAALLDRVWVESNHSPRRAGNILKDLGHPQAGVFAKRASRALVDPPELAQILRGCTERGMTYCKSIEHRFEIASRVAQHKAIAEGSRWYGFKSPVLDQANTDPICPKAHTVFIHRDPRDVWASHQDAGFDVSLKEVVRSWNTHSRLHRVSTPRSTSIRYEDLVQEPEHTLDALCDILGLKFNTTMIEFEHSEASIFRSGLHHVNTPKLLAGLNQSAIGRWKNNLTSKDIKSIERQCATGMRSLNYEWV